MIKWIQILIDTESKNLLFTKVNDHKILIETLKLKQNSYTLKIQFDYKIVLFRNHDYKWISTNQRCMANWYSPKILKLDNGALVQANQNIGIWEVFEKDNSILLWHFNPVNASPISTYDTVNTKIIVQANANLKIFKSIGFLFPKEHAIEISRSKVPFSAITCFTDHCDFDTLDNLVKQRDFFKRYNIKLTKGFFLSHYSKRRDTASYEFNSHELKKWKQDNHELAYHSLSQSIMSLEKGCEDLLTFTPPLKGLPTWIDHGFQHYNFSSFQNYNSIKHQYSQVMTTNGIHNFWNYLDSGTAARGVINQLNPQHFTLKASINGLKHLGFKAVVSNFLKILCFYYDSNDRALRLYRSITKYIKSNKKKVSFTKHFNFLSDVLKLMTFFFPVFLFWNSKKNKIFPLAKFAPVIFNHQVDGASFTIFQTIEMIDFKMALSKENIDLLIDESGLFIAHTYFSAPMPYHRGKLFKKPTVIDSNVEDCFKYLSENIASDKIWNPTFNELATYILKLQNITFDCDKNGDIISENKQELILRAVV